MISRLVLSLKEAVGSERGGGSLWEPSANDANFQSIKFFHSRKGTNVGEDDVRLEAYPGP